MGAILDALLEIAERLGREDGDGAGSWVIDVNAQTAEHILRGLEDGDPEVLDALPSSPLSGEWADNLTPDELVQACLWACGMEELEELAYHAMDPERVEAEICDAYEDAWYQAMQRRVESDARHQVGQVTV